MKNNISIIGMGDGGREFLSQAALQKIEAAQILMGGERHLAFFPELSCRKVPIKKHLSPVLATIKKESKEKKIVILVSGDPFFYGLGKYLTQNLLGLKLQFFPYPSSIQLAFARIGVNWDDAHLTSVHAGNLHDLLPLFRKYSKIGILTDRSNTPSAVASLVMESVGDTFICAVCENLEGEKERITRGSLKKIQGMEFSPLNVVILLKKKTGRGLHPFTGASDEEFAQRKPSRGLITKSEVRAVSISKMEVRPDSIVWDVGAGSGSVSVESASFAVDGKVYAMEKNLGDIKNIRKNIRKFSMSHLIPVLGTAPQCFQEIKEDPDVIFVGGTGGGMEEILKRGISRLKNGGRLVVNVIALENLNKAITVLKGLKFPHEIISVNIGRSREIQGLTMLESLNTVYIVYGKKSDK